jgi:UDP-GlcNAc:undecaprenyl-phosphate GlcNAc-1-phosphate transferase
MDLTFILILFLTSLVLHFVMVDYATRFGLVDVPNERSMHKTRIPRGAGVAMFLAVLAVQAIFNYDHLITYALIYSAISLIFIIGVLDDFYNVSPRLKFVFIFFATILVYWYGVHIDSLGTYFGYKLSLPFALVFPFTFFAIAGFTNALNLIDGLDGLAGSVSTIMLFTFLAIGITYNDPLITILSSSFIVVLVAFLIFNWHPAKIFMGDSGSLTLGFVISLLSILSMKYITPSSVLFIIAIPLLDTFIVMTRRIQRGISPFKADKNHIHHFLYGIKGDIRFTVFLLMSIQAIFSIIGFQLSTANDFLSISLFALLFFVFLSLFDQRLKHRKRSKKSKKHKRALRGKIPDMLEDDIVNPSPIQNLSETV